MGFHGFNIVLVLRENRNESPVFLLDMVVLLLQLELNLLQMCDYIVFLLDLLREIILEFGLRVEEICDFRLKCFNDKNRSGIRAR
jgi:integrase